MGSKYFSVGIQNPEAIYEQAKQNSSLEIITLGKQQLNPPLVAVHSYYTSYGDELSITSLALCSPGVSQLPLPVVCGFMPVPDRVYYSYPTEGSRNHGFVLDKDGKKEYELVYAIVSSLDNRLGIKVSFGDPINPKKYAPKKKIGSLYNFTSELQKYARILEDTVNGVYEDLRHIYLKEKSCRDLIGCLPIPLNQRLDWTAKEKKIIYN